MEYFRLLNLKREPFSNAADPDFFFKSRQHLDCLQQLELSIRNRRGMNVVIGDVGTGKTTLCHQLIRQFRHEKKIKNHLILNPDFRSAKDFLITVVQLLVRKRPSKGIGERVLKNYIRRYLSLKVLVEKKTIVLIIDEGQKLPASCLEILREFLNFEKGEKKLLQIVIFAQKEFELNLIKFVNFTDRINLYFNLNPMSFKETRKMIRFRLRQSKKGSNVRGYSKAPSLFSYMGQYAIYMASSGYPRKIVNLCHHCLLKIIVRSRPKAGWFTVRSCLKQTIVKRSNRLLRFEISMVLAGLLAAALIAGPAYDQIQKWRPWLIDSATTLNPQQIFQWFRVEQEPNEPSRQKRVKVFKAKPVSDSPPNSPPQAIAQTVSTLQPDAPPIETNPSPPKIAQTVIPQQFDESIRKSVVVRETPDSVETEKRAGIEDISSGDRESLKVEVEKTPPLILGQLVAHEDEIISWMVVKTYGVFKKKLLDIIIKSNPHIDDPDHVEGNVLSFPAIPFFVDHMKPNYYWIHLDAKNSLQEAFNVLRSYPKSYPNHAPNYGLIPYWNREDGLTFSIIYKSCFLDEQSARNQMNTLPLSPSTQPKIISSWNKGNLYFADPYTCTNLTK